MVDSDGGNYSHSFNFKRAGSLQLKNWGFFVCRKIIFAVFDAAPRPANAGRGAIIISG
jgi:hypothetical protein